MFSKTRGIFKLAIYMWRSSLRHGSTTRSIDHRLYQGRQDLHVNEQFAMENGPGAHLVR